MSIALFHDTVTLYLTPAAGESPLKRVIPSVKIEKTDSQDEGLTATIYLPLWGKRALVYQEPEAWNKKSHTYTLRPGDHLVCYAAEGETMPEDALTVRRVIHRKGGSRRLWHLEIYATTFRKEYFTYDGTEA